MTLVSRGLVFWTLRHHVGEPWEDAHMKTMLFNALVCQLTLHLILFVLRFSSRLNTVSLFTFDTLLSFKLLNGLYGAPPKQFMTQAAPMCKRKL